MLLLAYRLVAHGVGGNTVSELNATMDVDEFLTWAAYTSIEPFPEQRIDVQTALLMAQFYNANRGKWQPPKKATAFLPQWYKPERPPQTAEQMKAIMKRQIVAMGGKLEAD
jgi:hypothetical protein